jgi:hypothetical protein
MTTRTATDRPRDLYRDDYGARTEYVADRPLGDGVARGDRVMLTAERAQTMRAHVLTIAEFEAREAGRPERERKAREDARRRQEELDRAVAAERAEYAAIEAERDKAAAVRGAAINEKRTRILRERTPSVVGVVAGSAGLGVALLRIDRGPVSLGGPPKWGKISVEALATIPIPSTASADSAATAKRAFLEMMAKSPPCAAVILDCAAGNLAGSLPIPEAMNWVGSNFAIYEPVRLHSPDDAEPVADLRARVLRHVPGAAPTGADTRECWEAAAAVLRRADMQAGGETWAPLDGALVAAWALEDERREAEAAQGKPGRKKN